MWGTLIQLPWKREVGWLAADLYMDGARVEQTPRTVLQRLIGKLGELGYEMRSGVECEFFLLTPDFLMHRRRRRQTVEVLLRPASGDAPLRHHRRDF